ncbi:hypothetical protein DY000_02010520 [Brassica cretica]|uniref:Uncharacterized protein n=1 Tax=Brassica cretica TaxID=69181 RepID=A0ABQ7CGP6_BRACR|nr:hypothetical protein DY000_02010520 [Brassica cretica]
MLDRSLNEPELYQTRALPKNRSFTKLMPVYESDNNRTTISCKPTTQSSTRRLVLQPVHRKLKSSSSPSLDPIWNQFNPYCNLNVQNGQKWPLLSPSFELDDSAASFELEARKRAAAARALNWTTPELQDALSMGLLRGLELDETVISWRKEGHNEEMET